MSEATSSHTPIKININQHERHGRTHTKIIIPFQPSCQAGSGNQGEKKIGRDNWCCCYTLSDHHHFTLIFILIHHIALIFLHFPDAAAGGVSGACQTNGYLFVFCCYSSSVLCSCYILYSSTFYCDEDRQIPF